MVAPRRRWKRLRRDGDGNVCAATAMEMVAPRPHWKWLRRGHTGNGCAATTRQEVARLRGLNNRRRFANDEDTSQTPVRLPGA